MRRSAPILLSLITASLLHAQSGTVQAAISAQLDARLAAAAAADSAAYHRAVHSAAVLILDDGTRNTLAEHLRYIAQRQTGRSRYVHDSLQIHRFGNWAIADYLATEFVRYGPSELAGPMRVLDLYALDEHRWTLRAHAEAPLLTLPPAITPDASLLQDYVGRYVWSSGYVDQVALRGSTLTEQGADDPEPLPLRAATPEAFYFEDDPSLLTFVRDRSGRVSGYVIHFATGQVVTARRVS